MDLEDIMLCEMSQRKTNVIWSHLYVEYFLKIPPKKPEHVDTENRFPEVGGGGRVSEELEEPKKKESYLFLITWYVNQMAYDTISFSSSQNRLSELHN